MANIPITDNTTLLNALKTKAQNLPNRGTGSGGGSGSTDLSFVTATASDILAGKTGADSSGNAVNGSMTNNGAWSTTKTSNGDVPIPAGFHNGSGKVSVNVSTSSGALDTPSISFNTTNGKFTATSRVKTSGYISTSETKTASHTINTYLGGEYTPTKASQTVSLTEKYCTGNVVIKGDNNLIPANIKNGISIFGVAGSYAGDGGSVISITSSRTWNSTLDSSFDYHRIAYFSTPTSAKYVMCMATSTNGTYDSSNASNPDSVEAINFDVTNKTCYIRTSSSLSTVETEIGGGTHPLVIFKNDDSYGFSVFVKGTYLCYDTYRTFIVT